jgi:hypothetical protein
MNDSDGPRQADPGLCGGCAHARVITSDRGSRFYRCGLADSDPRFPRYPRLPVAACPGFTPRADSPPPSPDRLR